jgi:HK97 family phage major capsid protein
MVGNAQHQNRDLTDNEKEIAHDARTRVKACTEQLDMLYDTRATTIKARERAREISLEMSKLREESDNGGVEYRSAGEWVKEVWESGTGSQSARDRLEKYTRAAAHQKTSDNLGLIPNPIIGPVINFIDGARPLVNSLGPKPMPSQRWSRPIVTQNTAVAAQGSAGAASDEKAELTSQKMTVTTVDGTAVTYGGYVNVSRQNIDFSSPATFDVIVNSLATEYAIQTEAALGTALLATNNTNEIAGTGSAAWTTANVGAALWTAVGKVYTATQGQGRIYLACAVDALYLWGGLLFPVNAQNALSTGINAADIGQGQVGYVSGIPFLASAGLTSGTIGVVYSTAAEEVYEQRVGTLQVTEPSVLGVQVAYAGYFSPLNIVDAGVQMLVNAS